VGFPKSEEREVVILRVLERVGKGCDEDMMKVDVCSSNLHFCSSKLSRRENKAADLCLSLSFLLCSLFQISSAIADTKDASWTRQEVVTTGWYGYFSQQHRRNLPS
jgi:hypothetical protein